MYAIKLLFQNNSKFIFFQKKNILNSINLLFNQQNLNNNIFLLLTKINDYDLLSNKVKNYTENSENYNFSTEIFYVVYESIINKTMILDNNIIFSYLFSNFQFMNYIKNLQDKMNIDELLNEINNILNIHIELYDNLKENQKICCIINVAICISYNFFFVSDKNKSILYEKYKTFKTKIKSNEYKINLLNDNIYQYILYWLTSEECIQNNKNYNIDFKNIFFNILNNSDDNLVIDLKLKEIYFKNFDLFGEYLFKSIKCYRFKNPETLNFLNNLYYDYLSKNNDIILNEDCIKKIEKILIDDNFNFSFNLNNIISFLEKYLEIHYKNNNQRIDNNYKKYTILNFIFFNLYNYKIEYNFFNFSKTFTFITDFFIYSCFILDYLKNNKLQSSELEIKNYCIFEYINNSAKLAETNILCAIISCFVIRELIKNFSFKNSDDKKKSINKDDNKESVNKSISKVIFSCICFLYKIETKFKNNMNIFSRFFEFIDNYLFENSNCNLKHFDIDPLNDWSFLNLANIQYIPNFHLPKLFKNINFDYINEKKCYFEFNLLKRLKYLNYYEQIVIIEGFNKMLENPDELHKIKNNKNLMNKLNLTISYILDQNDFITDKRVYILCSLSEFVENIFILINKLFIDIWEYFYYPKNFYVENFYDFCLYLLKKNKKFFYYKTKIPITLLNIQILLMFYVYNDKEKKLINKINNFCINYEKNLEDENNINVNKQLIELMNYTNLQETEKNFFKKIICLGLYNAQVSLFLINSLLSIPKIKNQTTEINSLYKEKIYNEETFNVIKNKIIDYFNSLLKDNKKKSLLRAVMLYKYIENKTLIVIENLNIKKIINEKINNKKDKINLIDFIYNNKNNDIDNFKIFNEKGIKYIYFEKNAKEIKKELINQNYIIKLCNILEKNKFPKTAVNLLNKFISDYRCENNIKFNNLQTNNLEDEKNLKLNNFIECYYNAFSKIENNKYLLLNYHNDKKLIKNIIKEKKIDNELNKEIHSLLNNFEIYYIKADNETFMNAYNNLQPKINNLNKYDLIFDKIQYIILLYNIYELYNKSFINNNKEIILKFEYIKNSLLNFIGMFLNMNEKSSFNENINQFDFFIILYEFYYFIQPFKDKDFIENKDIKLKENLEYTYINREVSYLEKYIIIYQIRRIFCKIAKQNLLEIKNMQKICKCLKKNINEKNKDLLIIYLEEYKNLFLNLLNSTNNEKLKIPFNLIYTLFKYTYLFSKDNYKKYSNELNNILVTYKETQIVKIKLFEFQIIANDNNSELLNILKEKLNNNSLKDSNDNIIYITIGNLYLLAFEREYCNVFKNLEISYNKNNLNNVDIIIFEYLLIAINICIITNDDKIIQKYLSNVINILFKIQSCFNNSLKQSKNMNSEDLKKYKLYINILKILPNIKEKDINLILPQLLMAYSYYNSDLYKISINLIQKYTIKFPDLIAPYLASFFVSDIRLIRKELMGKQQSNIIDLYEYNIKWSKKFFEDIVSSLPENIKKILNNYITFQNLLTNLFYFKKMQIYNNNNMNKKKVIDIINEINYFLKEDDVNILAPFTENYNNYNPFVRNISENKSNNNKENVINFNKKNKKKKGKKSDSFNKNILIIDNKTLYFKQILSEIKVLPSKEVPLQIKFRLGKFHENSSNFPENLANIYTNDDNEHPIYNFLLKCDLNDISKELKTFQILTEINQLFHVKHYDENYNMLLTRYIISPISANIVLAEWLENSEPILSIIQNEYYKKNIKHYEEHFMEKVERYKKQIEIIKKNSIKNEDEKMNVLYNYFDNKLINPNEWYDGIKRYIITTAVWSMACKLIGLGDRHGLNIMLKPNGEVIHIDFGYVAGKGTILPIPEIVDFRFTLNIYRTLGIFEDNGLFLFICYKTLELFKNYYSTLKSQIEFYIFDPYFSSGDEQTYIHLKKIDDFFNKSDENLLNQIINMVNDCKDPKNLEKMFVGWMPFL